MWRYRNPNASPKIKIITITVLVAKAAPGGNGPGGRALLRQANQLAIRAAMAERVDFTGGGKGCRIPGRKNGRRRPGPDMPALSAPVRSDQAGGW